MRPAPCVEAAIVGSDAAISYRAATLLLALLGLDDDELAPILSEARAMIRETHRRLDRVELDRLPTLKPKLYVG